MKADAALDRIQADKPFTTVKRYDPADKARAYEMFMGSDKDAADIAVELGINRAVIATWAREGGWVAKRKEIELELMRMADEKYRAFVTENKLPVLRRQVRISGKIEVAIEQIIDDEISKADKEGRAVDDKLIRRMSEALATVSGVSTKAVGLADTVIENNSQGGGRVPLVAIGIGPQVPQDQGNRGPTIEVREVDL